MTDCLMDDGRGPCGGYRRLHEALKAVEDKIFAAGAPLGSETYFDIRKIIAAELYPQSEKPLDTP